jgi:hypothetical protein
LVSPDISAAHRAIDPIPPAFYETLTKVCGDTALLPQRVNIGAGRVIDKVHGEVAAKMLKGAPKIVSQKNIEDHKTAVTAAMTDNRAWVRTIIDRDAGDFEDSMALYRAQGRRVIFWLHAFECAVVTMVLTAVPAVAQIAAPWSLSGGLVAAGSKAGALQGSVGATGQINRALLATSFGTVGVEVTGTYFNSGTVIACPATAGATCDLRQLPGFVQAAVSGARSSRGIGGVALYARGTAGMWGGHDSNAADGQSASESGLSGLIEAGVQTGPVEAGLAYPQLAGARSGRIELLSIVLHVGV